MLEANKVLLSPYSMKWDDGQAWCSFHIILTLFLSNTINWLEAIDIIQLPARNETSRDLNEIGFIVKVDNI